MSHVAIIANRHTENNYYSARRKACAAFLYNHKCFQKNEKQQLLMLAAIALPMFVGCKDDSQDNTDKNKSEENVTAVTGVSISPTTLSLIVGGTDTLTAAVAPENATNKAVTWSVSPAGVVTVSNAGLVTAVAAGNATIIVSTADGGKTATCAVTVVAQTVAVTGVTLSPPTLFLIVGGTGTLTAVVAPDSAANKAVTWSSSDTAVAAVSNGVVRAVAVGAATISVKTADGNKTDTCAVTVVAQGVSVTGVTLSPPTLSLAIGGTSTLTATVLPSSATEKAVSWSSSAPSVATVANGVVTAVAAGSATITVITAEGGKTATCMVNVRQAVVPSDEIVVVSGNGLTDTIRLVNVEGGTFAMGCIESRDGTCRDNELPIHSVTLSTYKIGQFEVTQKLWWVVMGSSQNCTSPNHGQGDNYPVYCVSWNDVQTFLTNLNTLTGKNFRLPTEAEWEYAARGGNQSQGYKYSGSNNIDEVAWYLDNAYNANPFTTFTHIVGTKAPNELGIYDMTGNVFEWCSDWYGDYSAEAQTNPTGPSSGFYRVDRGGSFGMGTIDSRTVFRDMCTPDLGNSGIIGFRVVLPVE
jgi:uncharacterized protein YjdB